MEIKPLIIGWLAARGITLANDAADQAIVTALQGEFDKAAAIPLGLANDKATLTAQVTALSNDKTTLTTRATNAEAALASEKIAHQAFRKAAAGQIVDAAIKLGIKTVAERDAQIAALENSADLAASASALLATAPARTTTLNGRDMSGRQQAGLNSEQTALANEYDQAFQTELKVDQNPTKAHQRIMSLPRYSGLAAKLVPQKG